VAGRDVDDEPADPALEDLLEDPGEGPGVAAEDALDWVDVGPGVPDEVVEA
jgi:hypothetical protein